MANRRKELKIKDSNLWYLVGLITSDGCLSSDGRHIDITSKDYKFLFSIKSRLGLKNKISHKCNNINKVSYRIQIANRSLYEFLLSIGLLPHKSLIIKSINVPENNFCDFLRGLIDGDGGMQKWIHHTNRQEQWNLRISSGSREFLVWLEDKITEIIRVKGRLYCESKNRFRLKYGKMSAGVIIKKCYYKRALALERKKDLARVCMNSHRGWQHSKTVLN